MISPRMLILLAALVALAVAAESAVSAPFVVHTGDESEPTSEPSSEPSAEPSEEPSNEEVCVDAAYLSAKKFAAHDLVHAEHIRAVALCPAGSTLPCATPDHMVRVAGRALSYRQLCATTRCESRRIAVNSVLSHKWVEEHHDNAVLTMYDARHPEFLQRVLHRFIAARRSIARRF